MSTPTSGKARTRAEAAFKRKNDTDMSAAAQITAERFAREDKTARLRALRLAKEAADRDSAPPAAPRPKQ